MNVGLVEGYCPPVFLPFFIGQGEKIFMLMGENIGCMVPGGQHFGRQLFVELSGEISCPSLEDHGARENLLNPYQGERHQCHRKMSFGVDPQQGDGMPLVSADLLLKQLRVSSKIIFRKHRPMTIVFVMFYGLKNKMRGGNLKQSPQ